MGLIIQLFRGNEEGDLNLDFQNAQPTERELEVYTSLKDLLSRGPEMLDLIAKYQSADTLVRKALCEISDSNEQEAFQAVSANAQVIKKFFNFAKELEKKFPSLLDTLSGTVEEEVEEAPRVKLKLVDQQALAKLLADILDFALRFDELKMSQPALQNDFSFYRRSVSKHLHEELAVNDAEANMISFFLAAHIPMMTCLAKVTAAQLQMNHGVVKCLSTMANICSSMVWRNKFEADNDAMMFVLRAMTGAIVLFDHVDQLGAFRRRSPINMKRCCELLVARRGRCQPLINALKFSSVHFLDDATPDYILEILEE